MKDLNMDTQRAKCSNSKMRCDYQSLWDRTTGSDVIDGGYTRVAWLGAIMSNKAGLVSKWVIPAPNRSGTKQLVRSSFFSI